MHQEENLARKLVAVLEEKSSEALKIAKAIMLAEPPKSKKAKNAMDYYIKNWYNIIHPGLIRLAGESVDADPNLITQAQVAMLMLTAAFDVQDDIIDRSLVKSGKQTVFGKYGIDTAILIGNALLIKGFVALRDLGVATEKMNKVFDLIGKAFYELGNAHALEIELRKCKKVPITSYWRVIKMKAACFRADVELGAIIGKASTEEMEILKCYGQIVGELIVLRDDFIDVFEAEELRNRIKNEILPMPVLYALEDKNECKKIEKILSKPNITESDVDFLVDCIFKSKNVAKLVEKMQNLVKQIVKKLERLRKSQSRELMQYLALAMLEGINKIEY